LAGHAGSGYCKSHHRFFWGFRLYVLATGDGLLVAWCLATPKLGEREVVAAMLDHDQFPTKHHFAAHTGTAPLEASSGQVVRHRLSRAGGPQAESRPVHDGHGPGPPAQRRAGLLPAQAGRGKLAKEALRCLKRRFSDAVFAIWSSTSTC
jgi:hypothetical protein